jgi:hypothetical protein
MTMLGITPVFNGCNLYRSCPRQVRILHIEAWILQSMSSDIELSSPSQVDTQF